MMKDWTRFVGLLKTHKQALMGLLAFCYNMDKLSVSFPYCLLDTVVFLDLGSRMCNRK